MADLIDRGKIDLEGNVLYDMGGLMFCNEVQEYLDSLPTVDAVEVVRCKDCVHCSDGPGFCVIMGEWVDPEGYCYHAERKGDEQ